MRLGSFFGAALAAAALTLTYTYQEPTIGKPKRRRAGGRLSVVDIRAVAEDLQPRKSKRRTRRLRGKGLL